MRKILHILIRYKVSVLIEILNFEILAWCYLNIRLIQSAKQIYVVQSNFHPDFQFPKPEKSYFDISHRRTGDNPLVTSDLSSHDFATLVER